MKLPEEFEAVLPSLFPGWEDLDEEDQERCKAAARKGLAAAFDAWVKRVVGDGLEGCLPCDRECAQSMIAQLVYRPGKGDLEWKKPGPGAHLDVCTARHRAAVAPLVAALRAENEDLRRGRCGDLHAALDEAEEREAKLPTEAEFWKLCVSLGMAVEWRMSLREWLGSRGCFRKKTGME